MARKQMVSPPEEGAEAPEFTLPGAHGGQLRLGLRTVHGLVIMVFYRGVWSEECVEYFKALAEKDREINVAGATLVGLGPAEPVEARNFVRETGFRSYVLYDYIRVTTREYGLLEKDAEHGEAARPAVFLVGRDNKVLRAWLDERPSPEELLAEVSKITGLPKEPDEEGEEKPKKRSGKSKPADGEAESGGGDAAESGKKRAGESSGTASSGDSASGEAETKSSEQSRDTPEGETNETNRGAKGQETPAESGGEMRSETAREESQAAASESSGAEQPREKSEPAKEEAQERDEDR